MQSKDYLYQHYTWPELAAVVERQPVVVLPVGSVEDHGPHLPLDTDNFLIWSVCEEAAKRADGEILLLPIIPYGFETHHMDFPGTIDIEMEHLLHFVLDVTKSVARHGFRRILIADGHGSNMPNLDLVARRTNLETDAECILAAWWNLLTVDKAFLPRWRESKFPGGCAHACELETSLYLYLDGDNVRKDKIESGVISFNEENSPFNWVDLFAAGPATLVSWTSSYSETGVLGDAKLASAEKGREAYEEAVKQLARFVTWFRDRPIDARRDRHRQPPTMPMPWGQRPISQHGNIGN